MHEITLKSLQQEVVRAESEREADKQKFTGRMPHPSFLSEIKYDFIPTDDECSGILTCQNQRQYQEDRADVVLLEIDPSLSIIDRALLLQSTVAALSECLKDEKAGSTLVLNFSWQDELNIHILAANLGDSRSILCNLTQNTVTRLTCDHTMLRENEQHNLVTRGYAILKKRNEMIITAKETSKIVAVQKNSYLYPAGEGKPGLQMTRSLGDNPLHSQSDVFNRMPALSYTCAPKTEKCYLLSSSDGITDAVSDEEVLKILESNQNRSYAKKLCLIAQTAIFRGSRDNITSVITSVSHDSPASKMRLQFVADGHSGKASSEFVHERLKDCFILATLYRQQYFEQKTKLMPRELHYLENIFRFTETGLLTFQQGMEHINSFHKLEGVCKRIIENDPKKSIFLDFIPHSMMNDGEIKIAFDRFKTGEITAQEAVFLFLKRVQTLQLPDDHHKFLFYYKRKGIVLCDPNSSEFVKGIDDATSVYQGITAMIDVITTRMTNQAARIEGFLKKTGATK